LAKVKVGEKAPDFTLPSYTGENVTLSQFLGKKAVVLYFYPMDNSPVCSREAKAFRNSYLRIKEMDAEVIGVSSGDVESHRAFARKCALTFLLLSDKADKVRKLYGVPSTLGLIPGRVTYVIDKEGVVRHVFSSQFQPEKHAKDVVKFLESSFGKESVKC
jgi:peroxiredoxin Q/BCP